MRAVQAKQAAEKITRAVQAKQATEKITRPCKAKQNTAKQHRANQSRAKQGRAKQSRTKQSRAEHSRAKQCKAEQSRAEQSRARKAEQSKIKEQLEIESANEQNSSRAFRSLCCTGLAEKTCLQPSTFQKQIKTIHRKNRYPISFLFWYISWPIPGHADFWDSLRNNPRTRDDSRRPH